MFTKIIILLLAVNIAFSFERYDLKCDRILLEHSYDSLISQIGVREKTGNNDGEVVKYLTCVGLKEGNPYCAAGQYWCFYTAALEMDIHISLIPIPRTGVANEMFNYAKKYGIKKSYTVDKHFLIVWRFPNSYKGHIERITQVGQAGWVTTVAFNTSSNKGEQRDGNGVFQKKRNIYHPLGRMKIRGLIGFY